VLAAAAAVAVALAALGFLSSGRPDAVLEPAPLRPAGAPVTLTPLAITGDVREAAISPDGRLVAYVVRDGASETVYVQPAAGGPATAVVPPSETGWRGPVFSPDGSRLFLRANQPTTSINDLYEVP